VTGITGRKQSSPERGCVGVCPRRRISQLTEAAGAGRRGRGLSLPINPLPPSNEQTPTLGAWRERESLAGCCPAISNAPAASRPPFALFASCSLLRAASAANARHPSRYAGPTQVYLYLYKDKEVKSADTQNENLPRPGSSACSARTRHAPPNREKAGQRRFCR
jgi:hypothetical protein